MLGVTATQEGDWITVTRMEAPQRLKRELRQVLGDDWQRDEWGRPQVPVAAWPLARQVISRFGVGVEVTVRDAEPSSNAAGEPPPPGETQPSAAQSMKPDVGQPAADLVEASRDDEPAADGSTVAQPVDAGPHSAGEQDADEQPAAEERAVVSQDLRQRVTEDERAIDEEIAALQARIDELGRQREELRLFLSIYERYSESAPGTAAEVTRISRG